nr:protein indeterminate-domain 7-like [Ipomoea batatas]
MMMKGVMIHQPNLQQSPALDNQENMSNVTSAASGEASVSSSNGGVYPHQQHYFGGNTINNQPQPQPQQIKKKRNQPGNPDSEVIALSPKTLMATNRFVCEICNKGFQRDQNLQLHRRGHNLPWKLKQRSSKDVVRKKVYVCPETSCVHHDPSRALGDLTGIKKHFCRKHGEKKWKCEKCSKRYAVQSDWKAHSKTCGTREYRCDCGTLFSRRDSFITHRAFCDALAEESARAINTGNNNAFHHLNPQPRSSPAPLSNISLHFQPPPPQFAAPPSYSIKKEQTNSSAALAGFNLRPEIPPWLLPCPTGGSPQPPPPAAAVDLTPSIFQEFGGAGLAGFHSAVGSPHISATALLQKAAQMGATMSGGTGKTGAGGGGPTTLACAACKYQRRKCASDCILAPYFPHDRQRQFLNAHKLFGVSNITKIIRHLTPPEKDEAMRTIIYESDMRAIDPVGGCYRIIRQLQRQIEQSQAELDVVLHHLAYCRAQAAGDSVSLPNNNVNTHRDVIDQTAADVVVVNNNFGALREEWYDYEQQPSNVNVNVNVNNGYPHPHHYPHYNQPPQFLVVQNNGGDHRDDYHHHPVVDQTNVAAAWEMHARDSKPPPPSSVVVPASQLSQDTDNACDSIKPILDLSGYVEDLNFGPEETLEESEEVLVKEQDKAAALNEEEESLSNMLKIMI